MRIAYLNANYQANHTGGGHVHMEQFIKNTLLLGHDIWVYPGTQYPGVKIIPTGRINHIKTLRKMDALYVRLENRSPQILKWALPPRRWLYGFPLVIWEFNTLPDELNEELERSQKRLQLMRAFSKGCDLAVCVSPSLAEVVTKELQAKNVIAVSNGSDPDLFKPGLTTVKRLLPFKDKFNVVWIGTIKENWHDLQMIGDAARLCWHVEQNQNIVFHIIGLGLSGFMADMPPNVYYWGAENYNRIPYWLSGMQVGLSLYKPGKSYFNSPLKIFDYFSSGLAVVSTEHPLVNEIMQKMRASDLIIPHNDASALVNVLLSLNSNQARVKLLGLQGRQLIIEKYNWRQSVGATMDAMLVILKEKGINLKE